MIVTARLQQPGEMPRRKTPQAICSLSIPRCPASLDYRVLNVKPEKARGIYRLRTFCCMRVISFYLARSGKCAELEPGSTSSMILAYGARRDQLQWRPARCRPNARPANVKQNPQAIGALGGFCLQIRPLLRIGVSGDWGIRRSNLLLAGRYCRPLLAFGAMRLHIGMRRFHWAARMLARRAWPHWVGIVYVWEDTNMARPSVVSLAPSTPRLWGLFFACHRQIFLLGSD